MAGAPAAAGAPAPALPAQAAWDRSAKPAANESGGPAGALSCTGAGGDPWATGASVPCCGLLERCLGLHGQAGRAPFYKCVSECPCTTEGKDPWASGSHRPCCSDLKQCLGRFGTSREPFHKCLPRCPRLAGGGWCRGEEPEAGFGLRRPCGNGTEVKVLTYNLFWWNLFGQHRGRGGSAGRLIATSGMFDVIAFQECEDVRRVLRDGGVAEAYGVLPGPAAMAMAYDRGAWSLLDQGWSFVAEDHRIQYFGRRAVQWVRLLHLASNKTVFAANHHGPLPVNTGGLCGAEATAFNLLAVIRANSQEGDVKLLLGDFNADHRSQTQATLALYMHRIAHSWVDAVFSSCPYDRAFRLGTGGSDHQAVEAHFFI